MQHGTTSTGPFEMESLFMVLFTDDGTKMKEGKELVDSRYLTDSFENLSKGQEGSSS